VAGGPFKPDFGLSGKSLSSAARLPASATSAHQPMCRIAARSAEDEHAPTWPHSREHGVHNYSAPVPELTRTSGSSRQY
jgi:hypothetical protein